MWGYKLYLVILVSCIEAVTSDVQLQVEVEGETHARQSVCPGDRVIFTCTVTNSNTLTWYVNHTYNYSYDSHADHGVSSADLIHQFHEGLIANLTYVLKNGPLISTLTADVDLDQNWFNETLVNCSDSNSSENMTLLIASVPRLEGEVHAVLTDQGCRTVVVELTWTPPPVYALHHVENYTLSVTSVGNEVPPVFLNGSTSNYTLRLNYSSIYQFELKAANCIGEFRSRPNITLNGFCTLPSPPDRGHIIDQDTVCMRESAEISYSCNENLVPAGTRKSTCQDGQWAPDPSKFYCYADCGMPTPPVNGTVDTPSSTIEGSQVFYQCDTRFIPHGRNMSECSSEGQWIPDPSDHQCEYICEPPQSPDPPPVCVQGACTDCSREPAATMVFNLTEFIGAVAGSSILSLLLGVIAGAVIALCITTRRQRKELPAQELSHHKQVESPRSNVCPQERPLPQVPVRHQAGRAHESDYEYMSSAIYSKVESEQRAPLPQNIPEYTPIVP